MRILLTNDDGVNATGLKVLERIASRFSDDIWIVAPTEEQSGAGHSLTLTQPVRLRRLGERRFCVTGTPTDSVMMAIAHIMKDMPPDLVLSGVNRGANLGEDVTYSGTVSAAMEGALAGIASIALSQSYAREGMGDTVPFAAAEAWAEQVLRPILDTPLEPRTLVNINFPALPPEEVKGIRVTQQGLRDYGRLRITQRTDPRGYDYFWFGLGPMIETPSHSTDLEAIADGYVAVTPLHLDLTHGPSLGRLAGLYPSMARRSRSLEQMTLRRKSRITGWASIGVRVGAVLGLLLFVLAVHWFEREDLVDQLDGHVSFVDVIYFTMISITTTGYGDIVPVTNSTRLFDALVVTPIRIFFVLIFIGTAYTFVLKRSWNRWLMARLQRTLSDHIVVAGFGTSGSEAVDELIARGTDPGKIVVIDGDADALLRAEALGCAVLQADATRDQSLKAVRVAQARVLIISAGRDDTSILICLTARHLAPDLRITIAVRAEDNELPARAAGATTVINPVSFAGLLLAGSAHGPNISDYLADLASAHGRVHLAEREVRPEECGKSLAGSATGLGVRVYREGRPIGFWEQAASSLCTGDRIVEIVPATVAEAELPLPSGPARRPMRPD